MRAQNDLKVLKEAIVDLYLATKIRSADDIEQIDEAHLEAEKQKLMNTQDIGIQVVEYIRSSIEIIMSLKEEDIERQCTQKKRMENQMNRNSDDDESRYTFQDNKNDQKLLAYQSMRAALANSENNHSSRNTLVENNHKDGQILRGTTPNYPPKQYEKMLQKLEADIRGHIRLEHEMKIHLDYLEGRVEEMEFQTAKQKQEEEILKQESRKYYQSWIKLDQEMDQLKKGHKREVDAFKKQLEELKTQYNSLIEGGSGSQAATTLDSNSSNQGGKQQKLAPIGSMDQNRKQTSQTMPPTKANHALQQQILKSSYTQQLQEASQHNKSVSNVTIQSADININSRQNNLNKPIASKTMTTKTGGNNRSLSTTKDESYEEQENVRLGSKQSFTSSSNNPYMYGGEATKGRRMIAQQKYKGNKINNEYNSNRNYATIDQQPTTTTIDGAIRSSSQLSNSQGLESGKAAASSNHQKQDRPIQNWLMKSVDVVSHQNHKSFIQAHGNLLTEDSTSTQKDLINTSELAAQSQHFESRNKSISVLGNQIHHSQYETQQQLNTNGNISFIVNSSANSFKSQVKARRYSNGVNDPKDYRSASGQATKKLQPQRIRQSCDLSGISLKKSIQAPLVNGTTNTGSTQSKSQINEEKIANVSSSSALIASRRASSSLGQNKASNSSSVNIYSNSVAASTNLKSNYNLRQSKDGLTQSKNSKSISMSRAAREEFVNSSLTELMHTSLKEKERHNRLLQGYTAQDTINQGAINQVRNSQQKVQVARSSINGNLSILKGNTALSNAIKQYSN